MKKILKYSIIIMLITILIGMIFLIIFLNNISSKVSLNDLDKSKLISRYNNVTLLDINNNILNPYSDYIEINNIPEHVKNAFISIEDKEFYNHNGLNYKRIIGALINNIKKGSFVEGASTISQQLVKNTQLSNEKTIERKIKEMYITQELEKEFSKDEILELYLNNIYYGNSSYGIENASKKYFGKSTKDLSISEGAVLAGIIKSPATYSPIYDMEKCLKRRNLVLKEMYDDGLISKLEYENSILENICLTSVDCESTTSNNIAFFDYQEKVLTEASKILNLSKSDIASNEYIISTYMDPIIQENIYNIINSPDYIIQNANGIESQGVINVIDNKTNTLVAYASNTVLDVSELKRQPGSAIKPIIVYAPAIEKKLINPLTKILDEPININGYSPHNLGNKHYGYTSVRDCVAYSLNIPAVKIVEELGIDMAKEYAQKFDISFHEKDNGYALALGGFTEGVGLDVLTNAYSTFANNGKFKNVTSIREIKNKYGITIYKDSRFDSQIIGEDTAFLMSSILKDGVKYGTSKRLNTFDFDIAGKTGTVCKKDSNKNSDAISIAYTTDYSVGCWIGNYKMNEDSYLDSSNNGGTYATSAIKEVFSFLHNEKRPKDFIIPQSVQKCKINNVIYSLDNEIVLADKTLDDRYIIQDYFSKNNLPEKKYNNANYECILSVTKNDENSACLQFITNKYFDYKLIKVSNNGESIVDEISNLNENYRYIDSNIMPNTNYTYYVKYKLKSDKTYNISNKVQFIANKETKKEFYEEDLSWLFSR